MAISVDDQPKRRGFGKPFVKGASGNPKGRPIQNEEIKALALAECPAAFEELIRIYKDPTTEKRTKLIAIKEIFDRALGKAPQAITGVDGSPLSFGVSISLVK